MKLLATKSRRRKEINQELKLSVLVSLWVNKTQKHEIINTTYELSFAGNIMTMIHNYTSADKAPDMKRIILKYQRL